MSLLPFLSSRPLASPPFRSPSQTTLCSPFPALFNCVFHVSLAGSGCDPCFQHQHELQGYSTRSAKPSQDFKECRFGLLIAAPSCKIAAPPPSGIVCRRLRYLESKSLLHLELAVALPVPSMSTYIPTQILLLGGRKGRSDTRRSGTEK